MKWLKKLTKLFLWLTLVGSAAAAISIAALYYHLEPTLPSTESLKSVKFQVPLRVFSNDNKLIAEFGEMRRIPLSYQEIPEQMVQAFLAAEDDRFFEHPGVDYKGLLRAAYQLLLTGERRQGGSTITMQVARNFFLSSEKTFTRKFSEIFLSLRIEHDLTKQEILELYLNKIYMGNRAYGVGAAAMVYYGKSVDQLTLPQIAMIAGLPKAPSRYNPLADPERSLQRRDYVLGRMTKLGFITESDEQNARSTPITASLHIAKTEADAPYIAEMVRAEMFARYGNDAYTTGFNVYTTIDSALQTVANRSLRNNLQAYDQRHGYRGAEQHLNITGTEDDITLDALLKDHRTVGDLPPAIVTEIGEKSAAVYLGEGRRLTIPWEGLEWARPYKSDNHVGAAPKKTEEIIKPGDLIRILERQDEEGPQIRLAQIPAAESALVALHPDNGAIKVLAGGYDFYHSKFNRVTQALRQPGSGFKAIIYSAALESGFTPASLINDAPVVFDDPSLEGAWRPENYSGKFFGPTRLRYALTKSRNLVSIRLLRSIGIQKALEHAQRFGFNPDELPHNLSLALGSGSVTPLQMASAYAVLANGGFKVEPFFIDRIERDTGELVEKSNPVTVCEECTQEASGDLLIAPRVISPQNHYLMNSMMRDVITRGTAIKARSLGRGDLAGKTGTTNDQRDAWFNGFNRSLVAIAWVGFDTSKPLGRGEVGGRAALPAWIDFMKVALKDVPELPLKLPSGMVTVRIDPKTGKRASVDQADAIFEVFRSENAPEEPANNATTSQQQGKSTKEGAGEQQIF
ncbi:penicillin-binding protein 1A [Sedimenticola selenatireducens]|uniref:Penicillin-binding protein 1A n=1 Tax=Sedimenticola selenatireducens TaxID=191960 RepID=A0A558DT38_9GAMM|nr:penicillin-binding protein 1A [Sedimenticola selenatireducens]TVO76772.1 penicillin-binding protein 1A [Sedimenticola selenatireducens]TVT64215.1 MAG: penicillin-binding protein 1A [Sedimenticola selenatireducens]